MAVPWSWSTTVKAPQPAQLSLNLSTSAPTPPSLDALLDSTTPTLDLQVTADGVPLDPHHLVASALVAEVRDWLDRNKSSIAVDRVGPAMATDDGISIALHAFSRSAQAATLSLASATADDASDACTPRLVSLALSLAFRSSPTSSSPSASRPRKKPRPSPSPATAPLAQAALGPRPGGITLAAQLLDPAGAPLHFALAGLVEGAMQRWAKKLAAAFPLCFNARWIERVSGDLAAQRSVAGSLRRILALGAAGEPQSFETGEVKDEVEDQSALLMSRLSKHLSSTYPARFPPAPSPTAAAPPSLSLIDPALFTPPPSPPLNPVEPDIEPAAALEAALLLLSTRAVKPDPWVAPPPPLEEREEGAAPSSRALKGVKGGPNKGQGGGARGARRGRVRRTSLDADDMLLDDDPPSRPDSPPLDFDARPASTSTSTSTSPRARALAGANEVGGEGSDDDDEMDWQLADEL